MLLNFGSQTQSPIPPPNTVVAQQPDQGGGTENDNAPRWQRFSTVGTISCLVRANVHAVVDAGGHRGVGRVADAELDAFALIDQDLSSISVAVTQNSIELSVVIVSTDSSSTTQTTLTTVVTGQAASVIQAVDEALGQLLGDDNWS